MKVSVFNPLPSVVEEFTQSVVCLDITCKVLSFNSRAKLHIRAYSKINIIVGESFHEYLFHSISDRFRHYFQMALLGQKSDLEVQMQLGEDYVWYSISLFPVYNLACMPCGVTLIFNDIHENKLNELKNVEYVEVLDKIAWRQSHLFRAPLANIKGLTELLISENENSSDINLRNLLFLLKNESEKLDIEIHTIIRLATDIKVGKNVRQ